MKTITSIHQMHKLVSLAKRQGKKIGFVPTMGYLHAGHAALLRQCRKENDLCVLSIFVNPKQFGPAEDFRRYPRDKKHDEMLAKKEKVDIIFYPSIKTMYPTGYLTYVHVRTLADHLCGPRRPGHFDGVTTIVTKLLNIINPDILYLGQKDAQQTVIIAQMMDDLNWPTRVKIIATVREPSGLAMSSRNSYLSGPERYQAQALYRSLRMAKKMIQDGERRSGTIKQKINAQIKENTLARVDYIECVDAKTLAPLKTIKGHVIIALAVFLGKTRLIDNIQVRA